MSDKEDLEDGEIDTEDEDDVIIVPETTSSRPKQPKVEIFGSPEKIPPNKKLLDKAPLDDDWAVNVEKAIATALIKEGVEPPLPNITKKPDEDELKQNNATRSRRRKKPKGERRRNKKLREEQATKQKEKNEQLQIPPLSQQQVLENQIDEMDIDEYEMLGMRGGSPPPAPVPVKPMPGGSYDSNGSQSGSESYDSPNERASREKDTLEERRKRRRERSREAKDRQDNKRRRNDRSRERRDQRDRRDRERERERERDRERDRDHRDRDHRDRDRDDRDRRDVSIFSLLLPRGFASSKGTTSTSATA